MDVDDRLLLSYVDGELSAEDRAATDAMIMQSAELAERVAALRASCPPYRAAFEQVRLPEMPNHLLQRVDELVSVSRRQPGQRDRVRMPAALLAAFAAGIVVSSSAVLLSGQWFDRQDEAPWLTAIAEYQNLYGRETVANIDENPSATARVLDDFYRSTGMRLNIPDLREAGLTFKRIQQLDYHGRPLAQIVYLPKAGRPVALCVLEDRRANEGLRLQNVDDMRAATWRRDHQTYVFLTSNREVDVEGLASQIEKGNVAALRED